MNSDHVYTEFSEGFEIQAKPIFVKERSSKETGYYFFAYTIRIVNHTDVPCTLVSRHWVIRDGSGNKEEVRGLGVVGEQPVIKPGESFTYTSACPLRTPTGNMRGTYQMTDPSGRVFDIIIPLFFLRLPETFQSPSQVYQ